MKQLFRKYYKNIYIWIAAAIILTAVIALGVAISNTPSESAAKTVGERRKDVYNCLVVGKDAAAGLTDVIFIASIDAGNHGVSVVQIPRDTYLAYTDKDYKKINGAYRALGGIAKLKDYLADALSIEIDYYLSLSLEDFAVMVDKIGGVKVNVPIDMDYEDPSQGLSIHLKKGEQMLDGKKALEFIRYRQGYVSGDLGRIDAQKIFLLAFFNRLKNDVPTKSLLSILSYMLGNVETNANFYDCITLTKVMTKIDGEKIRLMTIPGSEIRSEMSGAWYYVISKKGALEAVNKYLNVYDEDVREGSFDREHRFSNKDIPSYEKIYMSYIKPREHVPDGVEN